MIAILSLLTLVFFPGSAARADDALFDPFTGYRIAHYRAPIPAPPPGVAAVDTSKVAHLSAGGAVLLDVHPMRTFEIAESGEWIVPGQHESLPGAIWLPVVGWGTIEGWAEDYLVTTLDRRARNAPAVVVFCQLDCWLSWNAAQRVRDLGYKTFWYAGGVDTWQEHGRALEPVSPAPVVR